MSRTVLLRGMALTGILLALGCSPQTPNGTEPGPGKRVYDRALDEPVAAPITMCEAGAADCYPCTGAKLGLQVNGGKDVVATCHLRSADGRSCRNGSSTVTWSLEPFDGWSELGPLRLEIEGKGAGRSPEAFGAQGLPSSAVLTAERNRKQSRFPERLDLPQGGETDWHYNIRVFTVRSGELYACADPIIIIKDPPV